METGYKLGDKDWIQASTELSAWLQSLLEMISNPGSAKLLTWVGS